MLYFVQFTTSDFVMLIVSEFDLIPVMYYILTVDLIGLLKWRDNPALLKNHLMQFTKVDGEEIVKVGFIRCTKYV